MKKIISLILTVALSVVCFAAFSGCNKEESNIIKIGVFEAQTGANGAGAMKEVLGIRYANSVKNKVTIDGKEYTIKLIESDNQSDDNQAVSAASKLTSERCSVILGSYGSSVSMKAGSTFKEAKIPAIGCSCTNPGVTNTNDYYFRVCFTDDQQGAYMAQYALSKGYKKALTLVQNGDSYSQGLVSFFEQNFTGTGVSFTQNTYQATISDFSTIITTAKSQNYDCIFCPSSTVIATMILKECNKQSYTGAVLAGDTWDDIAVINPFINNQETCYPYVCSSFVLDTSSQRAQTFVNGYLAWVVENNYTTINGNATEVAAVSACGYDAYMTAVAAIEAAGSKKGSDIQIALKSASFKFEESILAGGVSFTETGDLPQNVASQKLSRRIAKNNEITTDSSSN